MRHLLDQDDDGHWYLIPEGLEQLFSEYVCGEREMDLPDGVVMLSGNPNRVRFLAPSEDEREMTPEAKRDLAAQLLRSANEAEGHPEDGPSWDATPVAFRCGCTGLSHDRSCPAWVLPV